MGIPITISNLQLENALKEYCRKTYDVSDVNLVFLPQQGHNEFSCCASFDEGGGIVLSATEMRTIILNKLDINVDSIVFSKDDNNRDILIITNPVKRTKSK